MSHADQAFYEGIEKGIRIGRMEVAETVIDIIEISLLAQEEGDTFKSRNIQGVLKGFCENQINKIFGEMYDER